MLQEQNKEVLIGNCEQLEELCTGLYQLTVFNEVNQKLVIYSAVKTRECGLHTDTWLIINDEGELERYKESQMVHKYYSYTLIRAF